MKKRLGFPSRRWTQAAVSFYGKTPQKRTRGSSSSIEGSTAGPCCKPHAPSKWGSSCAPSTTDGWIPPKDAPVRYLHQTLQAQRFRRQVHRPSFGARWSSGARGTDACASHTGHPLKLPRRESGASRSKSTPYSHANAMAPKANSFVGCCSRPSRSTPSRKSAPSCVPTLCAGVSKSCTACGNGEAATSKTCSFVRAEAMLKVRLSFTAPWPLAASDSPSWLAATPTYPPSRNLVRTEIDAAIVLRRRRTALKLGDRPSVAEVVRLIADIGGYTGKSSGGPPGPTVIARGLERVAIAAEALASVRKIAVTNAQQLPPNPPCRNVAGRRGSLRLWLRSTTTPPLAPLDNRGRGN